MAVLLLILKIIGIILLILLGLILLILAVVLFVPVRYQVSGSIGEKTTVRIAVTWLLHAVSWRAAYEEEGFSSQLWIFGITRKGKKPDDGEPGEDDREDGAEEPEERSAADVPLTDGEQKTGSILADSEQGEAERFDERQAKKVCAGAKKPFPALVRDTALAWGSAVPKAKDLLGRSCPAEKGTPLPLRFPLPRPCAPPVSVYGIGIRQMRVPSTMSMVILFYIGSAVSFI